MHRMESELNILRSKFLMLNIKMPKPLRPSCRVYHCVVINAIQELVLPDSAVLTDFPVAHLYTVYRLLYG